VRQLVARRALIAGAPLDRLERRPVGGVA
jgi:hypothetical protein